MDKGNQRERFLEVTQNTMVGYSKLLLVRLYASIQTYY